MITARDSATIFILEEQPCRKTMQAFQQQGQRCVTIGRVKKFAVYTGSRCLIFFSRPSKHTVNSTIPPAFNFAACFP